MIAIIERAEDKSFAIYTEEVPGLYATGLTEQEAREAFCEVLEEQAEYYRARRGEYPEWYADKTLEYRYDLSAFFKAFPFFNVSKLAEALGINASLLRKYKEGLASASPKQREVIQSRYQDLIRTLSEVQF